MRGVCVLQMLYISVFKYQLLKNTYTSKSIHHDFRHIPTVLFLGIIWLLRYVAIVEYNCLAVLETELA